MDREEWLEARKSGLGGSDAASIVGANPWKTNVTLWEEKTGRRQSEDISDKPVVKYGIRAEEPLRILFSLDYPQYDIGYNEFKMHKNPKHEFIYATLDGELVDIETKQKGILEIKTSTIMRMDQMAKWKNKIPQNYYLQILHQLLATGWDFAILKAHLKSDWNGELKIDTRHYTIKRSEVLEDIEYLKQKEIEFWDCVVNDRKPNLLLPSI